MMRSVHWRGRTTPLVTLLICVVANFFLPPSLPIHHGASRYSYIVQSHSTEAASSAVTAAGGQVTHRLAIINGVVAEVDETVLNRLHAHSNVVLHSNAVVRTTNTLPSYRKSHLSVEDTPQQPTSSKETYTGDYLLYPAAATGAYLLREQVITDTNKLCSDQHIFDTNLPVQHPLLGWGVTVAVIDSGFMQLKNREGNQSGWDVYDETTGTLFAQNDVGRCVIYRDFLARTAENGNAGQDARNSIDQHGHGTHVISTIADNRVAPLRANLQATQVGVAPDVNLMIARSLGSDGSGTYADVILAIEWIVNNKATYNVRVLNLSIYTPVTGPYWADPLNQAVMRAWQAGITVVAAAGNDGPQPGTITVPGNVPYVITVGAIRSGRYNTSGADELATFSSRGPTESAFVKPDIVVPASRTIAPMPDASTLAQEIPEARIQEKVDVDYGIGAPNKKHTYYQLSGTSMAAAEMSGIAALILQANPTLTNDQVKYRLLATGRPAVDQATGELVYSMWEQGAGLVDAREAVITTTTELANRGMDIGLDLTTDTHYWGYTTWDEVAGEFRLVDPETAQSIIVWDGGSKAWAGTSTWTSIESLWAGNNRIWSGSTPATSLATASNAEHFVNDDLAPQPLPRRAFIPFLMCQPCEPSTAPT
jgi:serine protease AprX